MTEILVTAGPTREHLDDVRFLSNGSTGRMGYAIAAAARRAGCAVTLISGPTDLPTPEGVERIDVVSGREMLAAATRAFARCAVAFFVAAVADHRPAHRVAGKPAKQAGGYLLELVPNPDIAATLCAQKGSRIAVGFALEAQGEGGGTALERARAKLRRKHFDLCVLNPPQAMGAEHSSVVLLDADGAVESLPTLDKQASAQRIVERALALVRRAAPETGAPSA